MASNSLSHVLNTSALAISVLTGSYTLPNQSYVTQKVCRNISALVTGRVLQSVRSY